MTVKESITLYFSEGASDKTYQAQLNEISDDNCTVTFAYGRRGSALKDGCKTPVAVPYDKAKTIYDRLVAEKEAKGYTRGKDGTPFSGSSTRERSGIICQLLNPVDEREVSRLCHEPAFAAQEKFDGERRLIVRKNGEIRGINRKGLFVALPEPLARAAAPVADGDFVMDGEQVGDTLYVFDLLENERGNLKDLAYRDRLELLQELLEVELGLPGVITLVKTAYDSGEKLALVEAVRARGGEGVVFKNLDAGYTAGRPNSGGHALKFKFYETCSAIVTKVSEAKRSVGLSVYDNGAIVGIGNVTIPPNHAIPNVDEVVEVQYLYAYRGGALFQPVYCGKRADIDAAECTVTQLKYKQDAAA